MIRQLTSVFRPGISWSTCPISACWMPSLMASLGRDPARRGVSGKTLLRRSRTPHQLVSFIISQRWAPARLGSLANILLPPPGSSLMTCHYMGNDGLSWLPFLPLNTNLCICWVISECLTHNWQYSFQFNIIIVACHVILD